MSDIAGIMNRVYESDVLQVRDLCSLLSSGEREAGKLFALADRTRKKFAGDGILLRGLVEFSNECSRGCHYCGLNKGRNGLDRYRMSKEDILASVGKAAGFGLKTVVLQSGEDDSLDVEWLADVIRSVKSHFDIAVTLSCGEKSREVYGIWRQAGADRYLLKIETTNSLIYKELHPDMVFEDRLNCLRYLRELDYQVGSGSLVGLKGQTPEDLAGDIIFFKQNNFDMLGIGPFIPHAETACGEDAAGDVFLTLKMIAVTRIALKDIHMPATTAIGSIEEGRDYREDALKAGANVLMPNFTPARYRRQYEIYPHKRCLSEEPGSCLSCLGAMAGSIGRVIDYARGDSLKTRL